MGNMQLDAVAARGLGPGHCSSIGFNPLQDFPSVISLGVMPVTLLVTGEAPLASSYPLWSVYPPACAWLICNTSLAPYLWTIRANFR